VCIARAVVGCRRVNIGNTGGIVGVGGCVAEGVMQDAGGIAKSVIPCVLPWGWLVLSKKTKIQHSRTHLASSSATTCAPSVLRSLF
jgi:hypothetical protein